MGARGPAPKRSDQRRRSNKPAAGEPAKVADTSATVIPAADPAWHLVAKIVWESLASSGQNKYYTSTDWSAAYVLCESISREFSPQPVVDKDGNVTMVSYPPKGASLTAWRAVMAGLLMTEGDRRRAALELQRPQPAGQAGDRTKVTDIRSWKAGLSG